MKQNIKVVIIGDFHIPYHDMPAIEAAMRYVRKTKPEYLILNGDILDCFQLSSFIKDPSERSFRQELDEAEGVLHIVDKMTPTATKIVYLAGNHEDRIRKFLWGKAPQLEGLISLPDILKLDDKDIEFHTYDDPLILDDIVIKHGSRLSNIAAGYSVKKEMDDESRSVIIGHCHRLSLAYRNYRDRTIFGIEGGHLCDVSKIDYMRGKVADWRQGFSSLFEFKGKLYPQIHPIVDGEMVT